MLRLNFFKTKNPQNKHACHSFFCEPVFIFSKKNHQYLIQHNTKNSQNLRPSFFFFSFSVLEAAFPTEGSSIGKGMSALPAVFLAAGSRGGGGRGGGGGRRLGLGSLRYRLQRFDSSVATGGGAEGFLVAHDEAAIDHFLTSATHKAFGMPRRVTQRPRLQEVVRTGLVASSTLRSVIQRAVLAQRGAIPNKEFAIVAVKPAATAGANETSGMPLLIHGSQQAQDTFQRFLASCTQLGVMRQLFVHVNILCGRCLRGWLLRRFGRRCSFRGRRVFVPTLSAKHNPSRHLKATFPTKRHLPVG